ncbi:hypothetical protein BYT27DRAFT_7065198, partial [Phlegmacium glaucopus]
LSDKEKAELRAAGKCFNCKETGHFSRNCPHRTTITSTGQKPPGVSAFNIEPASIQEIDSDEYVEVLDSLPVGAMCFRDPSQMAPVIPWPRDEWREHYPWWNEPRILARPWIGDCYAMVADLILTLEQPYPGDEGFDFSDVPPELRFNIVKQTTTDSYVIEDQLTGLHSTIFRSMLENPKFDISHWFAKKQARALNLDSRVKHRHQMGDALSVVATKLLTDG